MLHPGLLAAKTNPQKESRPILQGAASKSICVHGKDIVFLPTARQKNMLYSRDFFVICGIASIR